MRDRSSTSPPLRQATTPGRTEQLGQPEARPSTNSEDRRIVAALPAELRQRLERSILGRQDLEARFVTDPDAAVQLLHLSPPALLLLYDPGLGTLAPLLAGLERSFPRPPFAVIMLAEFPGETYPDLVTTTLPVDVEPAELSAAVARALGLPARTGRRHLIRVGVRLDDPDSAVITGNTIDISATGMLFECNRSLQVGAAYQVSALGHSRAPVLTLRLVRQAESNHPHLHRYGATFEGVEPAAVERLIRGLAG